MTGKKPSRRAAVKAEKNREDRIYMKRALLLAEKGMGRTAPNPMVGAVIVKNGKIIGEGYHRKAGGPHAEREALAACGESPEGATLYVNLEPCCHRGKTPPCTEAILESGIGRVVTGSEDPNPSVNGGGVRLLKEAGIPVTEGVLREACDRLNEPFFYYIQTGRPYVVMKYAMTLDGKTAAASGESRWITGEPARRQVHRDRGRYTAIMIGVGTLLADDPELTCRIPGGRNPVRIICDTNLRTPVSSRIVRTASAVPTIIATSCRDRNRWEPYQNSGCEILEVPLGEDGRPDLGILMDLLGKQGVDSVLLEGGSALNWAAARAGIVRKVQAYIAPRIFGGNRSSPVGGPGVWMPDQGFRLTRTEIRKLGEDLLLEYQWKGDSGG